MNSISGLKQTYHLMKVFFMTGQIFDAHLFVSNLIKTADQSIYTN